MPRRKTTPPPKGPCVPVAVEWDWNSLQRRLAFYPTPFVAAMSEVQGFAHLSSGKPQYLCRLLN